MDPAIQFAGIQKFIKRAQALDYFEDPDYNAFSYDINHMFDAIIK